MQSRKENPCCEMAVVLCHIIIAPLMLTPSGTHPITMAREYDVFVIDVVSTCVEHC